MYSYGDELWNESEYYRNRSKSDAKMAESFALDGDADQVAYYLRESKNNAKMADSLEEATY